MVAVPQSLPPRSEPLSLTRAVDRLAAEAFDVAVIGGGISGVAIAYEAAARGLKVALLERGDFAAGTTTASTKLIHGGVRYLESYEFGLVREALRERRILLNLAPHLVNTVPFMVPHYRRSRRIGRQPFDLRQAIVQRIAGPFHERMHFLRHLLRTAEPNFVPSPQLGLCAKLRRVRRIDKVRAVHCMVSFLGSGRWRANASKLR